MAELIATKRRLLAVVVGLLLITGFMAWQWFIYHAAKARLEQSVIERLVTVASASNTLLKDLDHQSLLKRTDLPEAQSKRISEALTEYVKRVDVAYFYTLRLVGNEIQFVTSSLSPEEQHGMTFKPVFGENYYDAPPAVMQAFESGQMTTARYTDHWGDFFSVFVPVKATSGPDYLIGVDLRLNQFSQEAAMGSAISTAPLLFALVVILPLFLLWLRTNYKRTQFELKTAFIDPITGLPNRGQLMKDIANTQQPTLVLINIDQFREVSNSYGISFGDLVLREYAYFLSCYQEDCLAVKGRYRLQGAEFAMLFEYGEKLVKRDDLIDDVRRYANWFQYRHSDQPPIALSATLGIAYHDIDPLLLADTALRHAKVHKRDCVVYNRELKAFDMYETNLRNVSILREALLQQRLVPYFQPIIDQDKGTAGRFEVLARIVGYDGEIVGMPNDFVPIAERYRLNQQLSITMIGQAIEKMKGNQHSVSFNLSIRDVENDHTANRIIQLVQRSGLADRMAFELLENEAMRNRVAVLKFFVRLRRLGCRVGIDDLGKEYSNFDRLMELPLDFVKIDGALVHHALVDVATLDILEAFVIAAASHGIVTVAEGIDSEPLHRMVQKLGVGYCQGFYYGIPRPDFEIEPMAAVDGGLSNEVVVAEP